MRKNTPTSRKGRVVVDIRALNQITMPDAYPMPIKSEIIAALAGCPFISLMDCASFFYQRKVLPDYQYRLTVATHRGQETFSCVVIVFRNSPAYVQRIIDTILREERSFARTYIDDIVIFSKSFSDHVQHLQNVCNKLERYNIHLNPKKCFLAYQSVALLGQRVDALGLSSTKEKIAAIANLNFPKNLKQLEHYLGLTSWLRMYIPNYFMKAAPLPGRKLLLSKEIRNGNLSKSKTLKETMRKTLSDITPLKMNSFLSLQAAFKQASMLVHFDPSQRLYADVDSSAKGIGAMVYHSITDPPTQKSSKPILFLSRLWKPVETRYWPTEKEIVGLCWIVQKIRHIIESTKLPTVIYTEHSATVQIATQSSLTTTSLVRMNMRHVRSSEFLNHF